MNETRRKICEFFFAFGKSSMLILDMPTIKLPQKNLELEASRGENLMSFLVAQQIPVASSCLGDGVCSMCRMRVVGSVAAALDVEKNTLARNKCAEDERLSCQISIESDLEVFAKYW